MSAFAQTQQDYARLRPVRIWLYVIALLVLIMVAVGGITRLTDSGLSITTWKPISGAIPPLSDADWQAEFEGYKQIPEFARQNAWMEVHDFKSIFWWEWIHRFLGRVIGLAFFVPFVIFLFQKRLNRALALPLAGLFVLGGFQGFLGWWMVSSGLSARVDVSQYRLAVHLGAASLLFAALVWVARRLTPKPSPGDLPSGLRSSVIVLGCLLFLQLIAGAFVAGLDAGYGFNTWPLMDGAFIPEGLATLEPAWRNMFENLLTVQFQHRMLAYLIVLYTIWFIWWGRGKTGFQGVHGWMLLIGSAIAAQIVLGIATLLLVIPVPLAIGHQVLAFVLLGTVTAYLADMRN